MAVTLKDIAREADVTLMTVSNVINGRTGQVSEATSKRVRKIADRLGYVPSAAARSLASRSSRVIGCLLRDFSGGNLLAEWHNAAVVGAIEPILRKHGYHVLMRGIPDPSAVPAAMSAWNLDGAIFVAFTDDELQAMGGMPGKALVAIENYSPPPGTMAVHLEDRDGGYQATQHLIRKGHRKIAFAGQLTTGHRIFSERHAGYRLALSEAGIPPDPSLEHNVDFHFASGVELGKCFQTLSPGATAVFAAADELALGIISGLTSVGVSVPYDVSVIGFDNIDAGLYVSPQLSTVAQDVPAKAAAAVRMLMASLDGVQNLHEANLPVRLIERGTVREITEEV